MIPLKYCRHAYKPLVDMLINLLEPSRRWVLLNAALLTFLITIGGVIGYGHLNKPRPKLLLLSNPL